ncbi:MAG: hypothetical protein ABI972_30530, partial [Acidobacteriota bacterium]
MYLRLFFLCTAALAAQAATIVSVTGPADFGGSIGTNQAQTLGFTLGQAYNNLTISAFIAGPAAETFDAYLTTSIGAGTTVADEITSTTLNFPGFNPGVYTPIFSGLNLLAGTYYLTLFNPTGSGTLYSTESPVFDTAPGSSHAFSGYFITNDNPLPYPPSADFVDLEVQAGRTMLYSVNQVPEPASFGL